MTQASQPIIVQPIIVQDTFTGTKRELLFREPGKCGVYCCGPTVYGLCHIGNARAALALEFLVHETRRWMGSYFFEMDGADALVFTAGIGENQWGLREQICRKLERLGVVLDLSVNRETRATETVISAPQSRVKVLVIPTNEELVVAREARRLLERA